MGRNKEDNIIFLLGGYFVFQIEWFIYTLWFQINIRNVLLSITLERCIWWLILLSKEMCFPVIKAGAEVLDFTEDCSSQKPVWPLVVLEQCGQWGANPDHDASGRFLVFWPISTIANELVPKGDFRGFWKFELINKKILVIRVTTAWLWARVSEICRLKFNTDN